MKNTHMIFRMLSLLLCLVISMGLFAACNTENDTQSTAESNESNASTDIPSEEETQKIIIPSGVEKYG